MTVIRSLWVSSLGKLLKKTKKKLEQAWFCGFSCLRSPAANSARGVLKPVNSG